MMNFNGPACKEDLVAADKLAGIIFWYIL